MGRELNIEELELIDAFLLKKLNKEQQLIFDQKMQDPIFKEEVTFKQNTLKAFEAKEDISLKNQLREFEKNIKDIPPNREMLHTKNRIKYILAIIIFTILTLLSYLIYSHYINPSQTQKDYFAEYYTPYDNVVQPSVRNHTPTDKIEEAFLFYDQAKYLEAEFIFEKFLEGDTVNAQTLFYTAMCELSQGKINEAEVHLQNSLTFSSFKPHSLWYLALIEIKNKNNQSGIDLLEELLKNENPPFKKKAIQLLEELKKKN